MEENHGTIKKNHRTIEETMEKLKKTMEKSWTNQWTPWKLDKDHGTNSETSGKNDEQCEWEILAAKTKEGSLDDKKNMPT